MRTLALALVLLALPEPWGDYYRRLVPTRRIANPRRHQLKLAF